jgi:glycosyltransferase involved in cell wall biosynthesis
MAELTTSPPKTDRPLRILHVTAGSDAGGLSRYIHDLCSAMKAQGHDVAVAGERGAWHWLFENESWRWIDVPIKSLPLTGWRTTRTLKQHLAEHPVDVIHTHYRRGTFLARRLQQGGSSARVPVLYTVHLSHISLRFPRRMLTDFGDHTHAASVQARDWLLNEAKVPAERITVIPHGIDSHRFPRVDVPGRAAAREALGLAAGDRVALFVGRLDHPKNVAGMLDFAAAAAPAIPDLRVLLLGDGPEEARLRAEITARRLDSRVRMLGHRDDPLPIYQAADALLLPSLREGFSLVTAEAMSVGVPVLRTRTSGSRELIIEGVTGRSVPIERDDFVRGATEFLADREKLAEMGEAAAKHVREHFTFERQLEQTIALYRRLADNAPQQ